MHGTQSAPKRPRIAADDVVEKARVRYDQRTKRTVDFLVRYEAIVCQNSWMTNPGPQEWTIKQAIEKRHRFVICIQVLYLPRDGVTFHANGEPVPKSSRLYASFPSHHCFLRALNPAERLEGANPFDPDALAVLPVDWWSFSEVIADDVLNLHDMRVAMYLDVEIEEKHLAVGEGNVEGVQSKYTELPSSRSLAVSVMLFLQWAFRHYLARELHQGQLRVLEASKAKKVSLHVIIRDHWFTVDQMREFGNQCIRDDALHAYAAPIELLQPMRRPDGGWAIDTGVFTMNRIFRMAGCSKAEEPNRRLVPLSLLSDDDSSVYPPEEYLITVVTPAHDSEIVRHVNCPERSRRKQRNKHLPDAAAARSTTRTVVEMPTDHEAVEFATQLNAKVHPGSVFSGRVKEFSQGPHNVEQYRFNNTEKTSCPIKGSPHNSNRGVLHRVDHACFYYHCFNTECLRRTKGLGWPIDIDGNVGEDVIPAVLPPKPLEQHMYILQRQELTVAVRERCIELAVEVVVRTEICRSNDDELFLTCRVVVDPPRGRVLVRFGEPRGFGVEIQAGSRVSASASQCEMIPQLVELVLTTDGRAKLFRYSVPLWEPMGGDRFAGVVHRLPYRCAHGIRWDKLLDRDDDPVRRLLLGRRPRENMPLASMLPTAGVHAVCTSVVEYEDLHMRRFPVDRIAMDSRITLMVKAGMGSGKTEKVLLLHKEIVAFLKRHGVKELNMYFTTIGDRIARLLNYKKRAARSNIFYQMYRTKNLDLTAPCMLAIQLDSLWKIAHLHVRDDGDHFLAHMRDFLLMDESESLIRHLFSETLVASGKQKTIFNILCQLIKEARVLVMMDAHLGVRSCETLRVLRPSASTTASTLVHNKMARDQRHYGLTDNSDAWMGILMDAVIVKRKRVAIAGTSKERIIALFGVLQQFADAAEASDIRIACFTGDLHADEKNKIVENIDSVFQLYDVVGFTTWMESGVDCSLKDHFDLFFLDLGSGTITARSARQLLNRVRHLQENMVYVLTLNASVGRGPMVDLETVKADNSVPLPDTRGLTEPDLFRFLYYVTEQERQESARDIVSTFIALTIEDGGEIVTDREVSTTTVEGMRANMSFVDLMVRNEEQRFVTDTDQVKTDFARFLGLDKAHFLGGCSVETRDFYTRFCNMPTKCALDILLYAAGKSMPTQCVFAPSSADSDSNIPAESQRQQREGAAVAKLLLALGFTQGVFDTTTVTLSNADEGTGKVTAVEKACYRVKSLQPQNKGRLPKIAKSAAKWARAVAAIVHRSIMIMLVVHEIGDDRVSICMNQRQRRELMQLVASRWKSIVSPILEMAKDPPDLDEEDLNARQLFLHRHPYMPALHRVWRKLNDTLMQDTSSLELLPGHENPKLVLHRKRAAIQKEKLIKAETNMKQMAERAEQRQSKKGKTGPQQRKGTARRPDEIPTQPHRVVAWSKNRSGRKFIFKLENRFWYYITQRVEQTLGGGAGITAHFQEGCKKLVTLQRVTGEFDIIQGNYRPRLNVRVLDI